MINILNQPYISLDQYVNTETFNDIIDDIVTAVSKSYHAAGPTNAGLGYLDRTYRSVHEIYRSIVSDTTHPYHEQLKKLKSWEPFTFVKYKWPSHSLGQCLILRSAPGLSPSELAVACASEHAYLEKHDETKCKDYPIRANFKALLDWLDAQDIFSSIGRTVVFLNDTGTKVLEHRDYANGRSRKDQFIWISPIGDKRFYVRDETSKIYLKSKFCYFDNANIHGSDQMTTAVFTIRIDGIFSKKFLAMTGLEEHFND